MASVLTREGRSQRRKVPVAATMGMGPAGGRGSASRGAAPAGSAGWGACSPLAKRPSRRSLMPPQAAPMFKNACRKSVPQSRIRWASSTKMRSKPVRAQQAWNTAAFFVHSPSGRRPHNRSGVTTAATRSHCPFPASRTARSTVPMRSAAKSSPLTSGGPSGSSGMASASSNSLSPSLKLDATTPSTPSSLSMLVNSSSCVVISRLSGETISTRCFLPWPHRAPSREASTGSKAARVLPSPVAATSTTSFRALMCLQVLS
mmetsp:Transcript_11628/g.38449  ORF Transcript_11628/g.38449 Transcript_11628/m.38449 type:complete len:260 (-) Transcript_11628:420-1199(-)